MAQPGEGRAARPSSLLDTRVVYCGDNLEQLAKLPDACVDLIYIDPPFNSNRNYEVFWGESKEKRSFDDRHESTRAYIDYMRPRCVQLARVLKKTGSFYYHCDWHASHYVKVMLDQMLGENNFINEIIWKRSYGHGDSVRSMGRSHDSIFLYSGGETYTLNKFYHAHDPKYLKDFFKHEDKRGIYKLENLTSPNPRPNLTYEYKGYPSPAKGWRVSREKMEQLDADDRLHFPAKKDGRIMRKVYLEELGGQPMTDVWVDIKPLSAHDQERLGYPTQKPLALLERIIKASSNENDIVLDAFCGCGTALVAAQNLKRQWIGIDISPTACRVMAKRLKDKNVCGLPESEELWAIGRGFIVRDLPKSEAELRKYPHYEFENWAVVALGGIANKVKVGDMGIDGRIYPVSAVPERRGKAVGEFEFTDEWYPIQVKQTDKVGRPDIDAFEAVMFREERKLGYFVGFDFTGDALFEIDRFQRKEGRTIKPLTVREILDEEIARKLA